MYTAIRRYTTAPGRAKGIAQKADATFLPVIRAIPGFVAYVLVDGGQDAGRDVLATVSIFEAKEQADESVRRAALWVRENALPSDDMRGPEVTAGTALVASVLGRTPLYSSELTAHGIATDESRI